MAKQDPISPPTRLRLHERPVFSGWCTPSARLLVKVCTASSSGKGGAVYCLGGNSNIRNNGTTKQSSMREEVGFPALKHIRKHSIVFVQFGRD